STVSRHRPLRERQAETGPTLLARAPRVDPVEALEDPLAVLGRDPGALVDDLDPARVRGIPGDDADRAARRAVLDGVVDHVHEGLAEPEAVRLHADPTCRLDLDALALLLRQHGEMRGHFAREIPEVDRLQVETDLSRIRA